MGLKLHCPWAQPCTSRHFSVGLGTEKKKTAKSFATEYAFTHSIEMPTLEKQSLAWQRVTVSRAPEVCPRCPIASLWQIKLEQTDCKYSIMVTVWINWVHSELADLLSAYLLCWYVSTCSYILSLNMLVTSTKEFKAVLCPWPFIWLCIDCTCRAFPNLMTATIRGLETEL